MKKYYLNKYIDVLVVHEDVYKKINDPQICCRSYVWPDGILSWPNAELIPPEAGSSAPEEIFLVNKKWYEGGETFASWYGKFST